MKLVIFSHKECELSGNKFLTDGGFPLQMHALSELFDETVLLVPITNKKGYLTITGNNLKVTPLTPPSGKGFIRKMLFPVWILTNANKLYREATQADVIHTPIPGDVGTIGMFIALLLRKPLFVRHCGNWHHQRTIAERMWRYLMERFASRKNLMLATGESNSPPSEYNSDIKWIFSTSISESQITSHKATHNYRLITVCRIEKYKGLDILINSIPLLLSDFPDISLSIIGDGSYLSELKYKVNNLGISHIVEFPGYLSHPDVLNKLRNSDLFCYPTQSDGFPKVVIEAMACGLPVITSNISPIGIRIDNITPHKLANAITLCFVNYEALSKQSIETARQYTLEKWQNKIEEYLTQRCKEAKVQRGMRK